MSTVTTIGDRVKLKDRNLVGLVRFIGTVKHKKGIFYGIELDEKKGKNDGSMHKHSYFKTDPKRGVFIRKSDILKTNAKNNTEMPRVTVNSTVYVKKFHCNGIVRYIGSPDFASKKRSKSLANTKNKSSTHSLISNSRSETNRSDTSAFSVSQSRTPTPKSKSPNTPTRTGNRFKFKQSQNNVWYGIELSQAKGKNNGTVQGKQYFECQSKHGSFVRKEQIQSVSHKSEERKSDECLSLTLNRCSTPKAKTPKRHSRQRSQSVELIFKYPKKSEPKTKSLSPTPKKRHKSPKSHKSPKKRHKSTLPKKKSKQRVPNGSDVSVLSTASSKSVSKTKKFQKPFNDSDDTQTVTVTQETEIIYSDYDSEMKYFETAKVTTIGDRVILSDNCEGIVRFVGSVRDKNGIFYGIELDAIYANKGKNDGSFRGQQYFECKNANKSGIFVKKQRILKTIIGNSKRKRIGINDRVFIDKFGCEGSVKFIGKTEFKKGVWYGIELDEDKGKNDGSVNSVYYFECADNKGSFVKQQSITVINEEINESESNASTLNLLGLDKNRNSNKAATYDSAVMAILMTENDLAGFCLIWMIGLFYVIVLRLRGNENVVETQWHSIILIPLFVCLMTWLFSYYITKYSKAQKESMRIPSFYVPFFCKILVALVFFGRLMTDIRRRMASNTNIVCDLTLVTMYIHCILSVITSEIMITTVMVNSILNIDQTNVNPWINLFLFITRPILWVYNRLIVMFVSFYCYYYLIFGIGPIVISLCDSSDVTLLADIGVFTLLLPFHNVLYLFEFEKWTDFRLYHYNDTTHAIFAVIQQVLIFTTIFDLLMDIWSLYLIKKRNETSLDITKQEINQKLPQIIHLSANDNNKPTTSTHLSVIKEK